MPKVYVGIAIEDNIIIKSCSLGLYLDWYKKGVDRRAKIGYTKFRFERQIGAKNGCTNDRTKRHRIWSKHDS